MPSPDEEEAPLRAAHDAFVAGDYAESRRLAEPVALGGSRAAATARAFLARYAPDPVVGVITLSALAFFIGCIVVYGGR